MNKKPTNWLYQTERRVTKIRPKAVIFGRFSNFDKDRPETEVASDVISSVALD